MRTMSGLKNRLLPICLGRFKSHHFIPDVKRMAALVSNAASSGSRIPLLTEERPNFDQAAAYKVSAALCSLELAAGRQPVGRKIGFTNQSIWPEYNIKEPIWGYVYNKSTFGSLQTVYLSSALMKLQPRIEPELVFFLKQKPSSEMTERELLSCVEWIAPGFEIVISIYDDWKFTGPDATASNALHDQLYIGPRYYLSSLTNLNKLVLQLEKFKVKLYCNNEVVDTGIGSNVLGSPLKALQHLIQLLSAHTKTHPPLQAGEIVTTGTLTKPMPISPDQEWAASIEGIGLRGFAVRTRTPSGPVFRDDDRIARAAFLQNVRPQDAQAPSDAAVETSSLEGDVQTRESGTANSSSNFRIIKYKTGKSTTPEIVAKIDHSSNVDAQAARLETREIAPDEKVQLDDNQADSETLNPGVKPNAKSKLPIAGRKMQRTHDSESKIRYHFGKIR